MPHTPIHLPTKHRPVNKKTTTPITTFDKLVLVVSVVYPFSALPQAIAVFRGETEGVSVLSWTVFLFCASLFLIYGIKRRVPPMIVSNSIWIFMDALVVIGVLAMGGQIF